MIPGKVIGKFSIRIVPNQEPEAVGKLVVDYLNAKVLYGYFNKLFLVKNPVKCVIIIIVGRTWISK